MTRDSHEQSNLTEYLGEKTLISDRRTKGIELRHRFELYFVTLIFTLLALAIQTSKKSSYPAINCVEFIGWISLLISGLLGLYSVNKLWLREVGAAEVHLRSLHGQNTRELMQDVNNLEGLIKSTINARNALFIIGLIALIASRGAELFL